MVAGLYATVAALPQYASVSGFFRSHFLAVANEAVRGILLAAGLLDWFGFLRGTATGNWNSEFRLLITGTL